MGRRAKAIPGEPRVCRHCGLSWLQQDGKAPREYCTTTCRQAAEGPRAPLVAVPAAPTPRTWQRVVQARVVTIVCAWCGTQATLEQYPGPTPRYCDPLCRQEAERWASAERMRRMRDRRRTLKAKEVLR
jgi:hypothetical protein